MEQNNWIENILNSTNGITQVIPSDHLLLQIKNKINNQNKVSPKTIWLVAASIAALLVLNFSVIITKTAQRKSNTTTSSYFENELNKSNQLYQ